MARHRGQARDADMIEDEILALLGELDQTEPGAAHSFLADLVKGERC